MNLQPENSTPVAPADALRILVGEIVTNARIMARGRMRRDPNEVATEYDQGGWKRVLEEKRWLECATLEDYIVPNDDTARVAKVGGRLVRVSPRDYYRFRIQVIQEIIREYGGDAREIVEIGSGFGLNLFSLALAGQWDKLVGFDISANGVRAATEAAEHFGLTNLEFDRLDALDATHTNYQRLRGKVVFSYYCLEQLKYSTAAAVEAIRAAGPQRVIHIEPTTELLSWYSLRDIANYSYVKRQDFQDNIVRTVREFESRGLVRVLAVKRLGYAPVHRNDPVLICWEPR